MSNGGGCAVLIYSCGAFCVGIPLIIINLIGTVILSIYYDQSQLAIWLAVNTGVTLGVCGIAMLVFLIISCRNMSREDFSTMCCFTVGAPCILFFLKIGLCIWGIIELANYANKWNALFIFSICIIILQLIIYAAAGSMLLFTICQTESMNGKRRGNSART